MTSERQGECARINHKMQSECGHGACAGWARSNNKISSDRIGVCVCGIGV